MNANDAHLKVRYTKPEDMLLLKEWLTDPSMRQSFPMEDELEINDAVMRWISFSIYKCSLTILKDDVPCGIATLYLQPYNKLLHQSECGIIISKEYQNQGIGAFLMNYLIHLAKEKFKLELLYLHVFADNPAVRFYKRFGFQEFGRQSQWAKDKDLYLTRISMEKHL